MSGGAEEGLSRLVAFMARLRGPGGCEWDAAQTWATIAPYTIEEAYEVADAVARDDADGLRDELGDLALQVVFHSAIAEDAGRFTLAEVLAGIADKLERRHPHVFGDGPTPGWEELKAAERARDPDGSALAGVARALPALTRAEKIGARAARVGFDWPDASGARAKIDEELDELAAADTPEERVDELGDLMFAAANLARHLNVDPEAALRAATDKFERRFRAMEAEAGSLSGRPLDELEALWAAAKLRTTTTPSPRSPSGESPSPLKGRGLD